jgi:membrane protease YdiL (CAAX protease family)
MNPDDNNFSQPPQNPGEPSGFTPESEGLGSLAHVENPAEVAAAPPPVSYVPEDLRVPWGWLDLLIIVVVTISAAFLLAMAVAIGLAALGGDPRKLQNSTNANFLIVAVQVILDLAIIAFLAAQIRLRFHLPFWKTVGWRPLETRAIPRALAYLGLVISGCLIAVLVTMASAISPPKGELPIQQILQDRHTLILFALMAVLIAPVVEETLFRGYLYPVVARSFGVGTGIITTGIIFGLLHAGQLAGGWWQIGLLVIVGILFTFARAVTKTVVTGYILHFSYNAIQVIALLVDTHGFRQLPSLH